MKANNIATEDVVEIGKLNLTGNVIPLNWLKTIRHADKKNGTPYLEAIMVLSEIVYWYRPTAAGEKKFSGDKLQIGYAQFGSRLFLSARAAKTAIAHLRKIGLIETEFRDMPYYNAMYISINVEALKDVTFGDPKAVVGGDPLTGVEDTPNWGSPRDGGGVTPRWGSPPSRGIYREYHRLPQRVPKE